MPKTMDLGEFEGIEENVFYPAVKPKPNAQLISARYWRVRTYGTPVPVGTFVAGSVGGAGSVLRFAEGTVEIIDRHGKLVPAALPYLVPLLSAAEVHLLQLFGVDLARFVRRAK
jgi:hypothetical protein